MAIDKLIPQYLNSDTDQKLVKSVEMTDNLNVRVSNDAEGTEGVIKNVKGTEAVTAFSPLHDLPAGENRVIGSVANEKNNEVLFFLWNSNRNHGIYRIDTKFDTYKKVYEDSVLGFNKLHHVDCDVVINDKEQTLLYWTDNVNPPMKINVNRALENDYPASLTSGTDEEKLLNLTVAKQPPLKAPTYSIVNNPNLPFNNIKDKVFQFAYKYIYEDGEHSALSPYSSLTVSKNQMRRGFTTYAKDNFFNQINVFVKNTVADAKEIVLYYREGNKGTFYEAEKIDNNYTSNAVTINFSNQKIGIALSQDETNKPYDNVPQKAKSQEIAGGRLMYGNYTEGYKNINVESELLPNYAKAQELSSIPVSVFGTNGILLDWTGFPTNGFIQDAVVSFNVVYNGDKIELRGTLASNGIDFENAKIQFSDKDGLNVGTDTLTGTDSGVEFNTTGIQLSSSIEIPSGTSYADAIELVVDGLLSKKINALFTHTNDQEVNFNGGGKGIVNARASFYGSNRNDTYTSGVLTSTSIVLSIYSAEISIFKYFKNSKDVNVISNPILKTGVLSFAWLGASGYISGASIWSYEDGTESKCFSSGSNHKLGIVYYDDRNRSSGVQELGEVYVNSLNDRADENDHDGASSIVMRLSSAAPSWAKKWSPVYTGKGINEIKLTYSVGGAFVPFKDDGFTTLSSSKGHIYLSLNTVFGQNFGYNDTTGASLEYKFEKGDRLRIITFGNNQSTIKELNVVGYKTLGSDETNPILDKSSKRAEESTTGEFIIVEEDETINGFTIADILERDTHWNNKCVVQIYNTSEFDSNVYYEIGRTYDVNNGVHSDDREATTLDISITSANGSELEGYTVQGVRIFKGDEISIGGTTIIVGNVYNEGGVYYFTASDKSVTPLSVGSYAGGTITNTDKVIEVKNGDAYFRRRLLLIPDRDIKIRGGDVYYPNYSGMVKYIEDYSVSDFFKSTDSSIGRPFAYIPDAKTVRRKASVTYSDPYVLDSDRLNLSSFNLSLANWKDLDILYGGVYNMVSRGDALTVLQESKVSQIPVNRNLIEYANGDAGVSVSKNVLGAVSYYAGNYGTSNPESVVNRFGIVYFTDLNSRKVIRLSADGITPISDKGMDSFVQKVLENLDKNVTTPKIVGGFDPDNDEYLITVEDLFESTIVIQSSDPELEPTEYEVEINDDSEYEVSPIYTSSTILWNEINANWNNTCLDWNDLGNGILYLDTSTLYLDSILSGSTGSITILVTDSSWSFVAAATFQFGTNVITMPQQTCDGKNIATSFGGAGLTIGYKHKEGVWSSKYSFKPTNYANIGNALYGFFHNENGTAWKHNVNETRNNFYGTQYDSMFEVVSNMNPSMIKVYEALGVEGDGTWSAVLSNSDQITTLSTSDFDNREGHRYAMIPRDTLVSTGHQIYLGKVEAVSGDTVTFTTPVNRLPFVVGDYLYTASGSTLTNTTMNIAGITDRKTIQCTSAVSGISAGDDIFVQHSARVDGDPMRGVFLKLKMTSSDTTPFEVHALSVSYDRSRLHNDRVN